MQHIFNFYGTHHVQLVQLVRDQNIDQEDVSSSLARPPTRLFRSQARGIAGVFQRGLGNYIFMPTSMLH